MPRSPQDIELDRWANRPEKRYKPSVTRRAFSPPPSSDQVAPALRRRFERLPWVDFGREPAWRTETLRELLGSSRFDLALLCDALEEGRDCRAAGEQDRAHSRLTHTRKRIRAAGVTASQSQVLLMAVGLLPLGPKSEPIDNIRTLRRQLPGPCPRSM